MQTTKSELKPQKQIESVYTPMCIANNAYYAQHPHHLDATCLIWIGIFPTLPLLVPNVCGRGAFNGPVLGWDGLVWLGCLGLAWLGSLGWLGLVGLALRVGGGVGEVEVRIRRGAGDGGRSTFDGVRRRGIGVRVQTCGV